MNMYKSIALLLLCCCTFAADAPACPSYPYHDFVWASTYSPPVRPADTLLDNCQSLGLNNSELCNVVNDTRLTTDQKKQLILDDFVKNNGFPPFSEADSWNSRIPFTKYPPDGVSTSSSAYLKDAWVKITALSPAVIDSSDNKTYINDTGKLRMSKAFTFVIPKETFPGDCRTEYAVCGYSYSLNAFDNGASLNNQNQPIANFAVPSPYHLAENNFSAVLSVNSQYMINHYQLVTHCYTSNGITYCYTTCDYYGTDDRHDSLTVSDVKKAYYYGFIAFQNAFVESFKNNLTDGWLFLVSNEDFNTIVFSIENSSMKLQSRQYQLRHSLAPYNTLTPAFITNPNKLQTKQMSILSRENRTLSGAEFDQFLKVTEPNLYFFLTQWLGINLSALPITFHGDKVHFLAPAQELNCSLEINSHFESQMLQDVCSYNATQQPTINLTIANLSNSFFTAKASFFDNSTNLSLAGKNLSFSYGNQSASAITDTNGSAQIIFTLSKVSNLVTAEFLTDFETKSAKAYAVMPAQAPEFLSVLLYLVAIAVLAWLTYRMLKRWFS